MAARTGNLPQLGRHAAQRCARRAAACSRARQRRGDGARQQRHRGRRGGDQDRARRHRPRRACSTPSTPFTGSRWARSRSTATAISAMASARCCGAATRSRSAISPRWSASSRAGDVAAFVVEPVQGKGVNLPPEGYLRGAQERCRAAGALFVCDEVQTGIGRTGRFLALEHWGLEPDIICVAKALSGVSCRSARCSSRARLRPRVRRHGAGRAPRLDLRRQRPRRRRRAGHAARARSRGLVERAGGWASCCSSSRAAGGAPRGRARRARRSG